MRNNQLSICDLCLDYLSGVCSNQERLAFEQHLPNCQACQTDLYELRTTWEAIPDQMDIIEPPPDLKQQVMNAISPSPSKNIIRLGWTKLAAAMLLGVLLTTGAWWWSSTSQVYSVVPPLEYAHAVDASQLKKVVPLTAVPGQSGYAYGLACIVDNGHTSQFVVYVFGTPHTKGNEVYQVWLLKDNERTNAGTFRVNAEGIGLLSFPIADHASFSFDSIGITLEPDDQGTTPRGKKIFQSTT
jgi:hypothetical protein